MFLYLEKWILNFSNILSKWDHHLFHQSAVSIGLDIYWLFRTKLHVWNQKIGDDLLDSLQKMKTTNKYYQIILQVVNLAIPSINTSSILHQHLVGWHSIDIRPTCWLTVGRETTYFRLMYIYIWVDRQLANYQPTVVWMLIEYCLGCRSSVDQDIDWVCQSQVNKGCRSTLNRRCL